MVGIGGGPTRPPVLSALGKRSSPETSSSESGSSSRSEPEAKRLRADAGADQDVRSDTATVGSPLPSHVPAHLADILEEFQQASDAEISGGSVVTDRSSDLVSSSVSGETEAPVGERAFRATVAPLGLRRALQASVRDAFAPVGDILQRIQRHAIQAYLQTSIRQPTDMDLLVGFANSAPEGERLVLFNQVMMSLGRAVLDHPHVLRAALQIADAEPNIRASGELFLREVSRLSHGQGIQFTAEQLHEAYGTANQALDEYLGARLEADLPGLLEGDAAPSDTDPDHASDDEGGDGTASQSSMSSSSIGSTFARAAGSDLSRTSDQDQVSGDSASASGTSQAQTAPDVASSPGPSPSNPAQSAGSDALADHLALNDLLNSLTASIGSPYSARPS